MRAETLHASSRACKQIPEECVFTNSKEAFIMHVNSHEEDEEPAAGHRHLDLQHTTSLLGSCFQHTSTQEPASCS